MDPIGSRAPPADPQLSSASFFFQAEDGIRDRSPSRGLGDVYKRQVDLWRMLKIQELQVVSFSI